MKPKSKPNPPKQLQPWDAPDASTPPWQRPPPPQKPPLKRKPKLSQGELALKDFPYSQAPEGKPLH